MRAATAFLLILLAGAPLLAEDSATPQPQPQPQRTPEQVATLKRLVLEGLEDKRAKTRAEAGDMLVAAWPDSAPILDAALVAKSDVVRLEAVRLLGREELGDMRTRIRGRFTDTDDRVRLHAVRLARHLDWPEVEPDLADLLTRESSWFVRQEVLRGFEERGTVKCLKSVLAGWTSEEKADRKVRYKRVLVKVIGKDLGEDLDAWRTAVQEAETNARAKRSNDARR